MAAREPEDREQNPSHTNSMKTPPVVAVIEQEDGRTPAQPGARVRLRRRKRGANSARPLRAVGNERRARIASGAESRRRAGRRTEWSTGRGELSAGRSYQERMLCKKITPRGG